jgi:hypothetical protein
MHGCKPAMHIALSATLPTIFSSIGRTNALGNGRKKRSQPNELHEEGIL